MRARVSGIFVVRISRAGLFGLLCLFSLFRLTKQT